MCIAETSKNKNSILCSKCINYNLTKGFSYLFSDLKLSNSYQDLKNVRSENQLMKEIKNFRACTKYPLGKKCTNQFYLRVCMICIFYTELIFRINTCLGRAFYGRLYRGGGRLFGWFDYRPCVTSNFWRSNDIWCDHFVQNIIILAHHFAQSLD